MIKFFKSLGYELIENEAGALTVFSKTEKEIVSSITFLDFEEFCNGEKVGMNHSKIYYGSDTPYTLENWDYNINKIEIKKYAADLKKVA